MSSRTAALALVPATLATVAGATVAGAMVAGAMVAGATVAGATVAPAKAAALAATPAAVASTPEQAIASQGGVPPRDGTGHHSSAERACPPGSLAGIPQDRPLMFVVGASFTAGLGAGSATSSWPYLLAEQMGWRLVVDGVPGVGYVHRARDGGGPIGRLLRAAGLKGLAPSLVIIQAGHDDIGEPLTVESERVKDDVDFVRREVPAARLALVTVFTHQHHRSGRAIATDSTIVSAARRADPDVLIIDPLAGNWQFPRVRGGLHPDQVGERWISGRVEAALVAHGTETFTNACQASTGPAHQARRTSHIWPTPIWPRFVP